MSDKVKLAVRLDDITPDMDWKCFLAFKDMLDSYQIRPCIGVVPDNQDENLNANKDTTHPLFWSYIKDLQQEGWSVAMHGYQHIYSTKKRGLFPLNPFSEFAGVPYEKQLDKLQRGQMLLRQKGIETTLFMAPAHSYDRNTLKALKEAGFDKLTDGFGKKPYLYKNLTFYPISFHLKKTFSQKGGYSTLVVHTGTCNDLDLEKYRTYFENPNVEWISYQEFLQQTPIKAGAIHRMIEYSMAGGKALVSSLRGFLKRR